LKSTLDDDEGLATRLSQLRLRDQLDYEGSRDAVRRHGLQVRGRALRRGLSAANDRARSDIDPRRLPTEHLLADYDRRRRRHTTVVNDQSAHRLRPDAIRLSCSVASRRVGPQALDISNSNHSLDNSDNFPTLCY